MLYLGQLIISERFFRVYFFFVIVIRSSGDGGCFINLSFSIRGYGSKVLVYSQGICGMNEK